MTGKVKWVRKGRTYQFKTGIDTPAGPVLVKLVRGNLMWVLSTTGAFELDAANVALKSASTAFAKKEALTFLKPRIARLGATDG